MTSTRLPMVSMVWEGRNKTVITCKGFARSPFVVVGGNTATALEFGYIGPFSE